MTLRVSIRNENGVALSLLHRYTTGDTDQTAVFLERSEPVKECDVRDREVVSIVAPWLGSTHRRLSCSAVPGRCR
jgi:hypothetical protein